MYEKAWELSDKHFSRAKRSLALSALSKGKVYKYKIIKIKTIIIKVGRKYKTL